MIWKNKAQLKLCIMDFKMVVYNAARDGKLHRLKVFIFQTVHFFLYIYFLCFSSRPSWPCIISVWIGFISWFTESILVLTVNFFKFKIALNLEIGYLFSGCLFFIDLKFVRNLLPTYSFAHRTSHFRFS